MPQPFTLIHVSDPHFHALPRRVSDWLGKRGVGALNLLLNRRRQFPLERARRLVRLVDTLAWDHLVVSGDLTQLGLRHEMELARREMEPWLARGAERVTIIPGNHDRYVPGEEVQGSFDTVFSRFSPQGAERFCAKRLTGRWWLAAWDSAIPRPLFHASGWVAPETLRVTERWLAGLPTDARVVLANHYPLAFPEDYRVRTRHELLNLSEVQAWLANQPIELYLHGHVHRNWVISRRGAFGTQWFVNSASSTQVPGRHSRSSFHRIHLPEQGPPVIEPLAAE